MSIKIKTLLVFITLVIGFVFVGTGILQAAEDKPYEGTTLTWICSAQPSTDAAKAMISDFEKESGIKVQVDLMDEVRMLEKLLVDKSMGTKSYDVVSIESTWIDLFIKNQIITNIDELIQLPIMPVPGFDLDDFPNALVEAQCIRNDQLWMMPFGCGTSFLALRDDWFNEAGIGSPNTWDEVIDSASKLTEDVDNDGKKDRFGISLRGIRGIHSVFVYYCIAQPFGFEHLDADMKPLLESEQALKGLQTYVELGKYAPSGLPTWTHEEAATAFNEGLAAMYLDVSQLIPWVESQLPGKVRYIPLPKVDPYPFISTLSGWGIGIHYDSDAKEAAALFIEYITSKRNAKEFVGLGGSPGRISTLTDPELVEDNSWYKYQLERFEVAKFAWPNVVEIPEWNDILGKYITESLVGTISPEEALKKANEEIYQMLEKAGYYE